jgi:hypothetical protein
MRCTLLLAGAVLALQPPVSLSAQKVQWSDAVYVPGRWEARRLVRTATRNAATDTLALVARVDYFVQTPRWRAEIRRTGDGQTVGNPDILLGNGATVSVVTPVGVVPLAQHALARDSLTLHAAAALDAYGRRRDAASGRLVQTAASGTVASVVFRRAARTASFADALLDPRRSAGGRDLLASGVQQVGDQRSASVVATAGARGVDRVQTPRGVVSVRPDSNAVWRMEQFAVGTLRLEEFLRKGGLGVYAVRATPEVRP